MSDSNYRESDDESCCSSIAAARHLTQLRRLQSIWSDREMLDNMSTSSGGSSSSSSVRPALSVSDDDDSELLMDIEDDDDDMSDTSDTSTPLDETEYEIDDSSDGDDIADPNMDTVAHSRPPPTLDGRMSKSPASCSTTPMCTEENTATRSQPSPTFYRPMSMLSTFSSTSSTCTEEEIVIASCSGESNGEENSSSSIKNYLPPNPSTYKLCFDNGIEVDRILGAVVHNTQLLFRVRWRNDKNGGTDYVDAYEMHEKCPHMSLQFYTDYYKNKNKYKNTDKTDK